jgi:hypothetical protein
MTAKNEMRPKAGHKKMLSSCYLSLFDHLHTSALMTEIALVLYPKSNIWIQKRFFSQLTEKHRVFYQIVSCFNVIDPT